LPFALGALVVIHAPADISLVDYFFNLHFGAFRSLFKPPKVTGRG